MIRIFKTDSSIISTHLFFPDLNSNNNTVETVMKSSNNNEISSNHHLEKEDGIIDKKPLFNVGDSSIRIAYSNQRYESPKDLFTAPRNGALQKAQIPTRLERDGEAVFLASGKVLTK